MANKPTLLPREHGAYAELFFPLLTGILLAAPTLPALALGAASVALFLANEPVAILLGVRGQRLLETQGARARTRAGVLVGLGFLLGILGLAGAGSAVWPEILLPVLTGALLVPLVLMGKQKSLVGEFLVLSAFSTLLLPLAAASGADPGRAILATAVWWISFAMGTLEVHAIKARSKGTRRSQWTKWGSPLVSGITVLAALALSLGFLNSAAAPFLVRSAVAVLIPAIATLILSARGVDPKHLKRVGWTLVVANTGALLVLLLG